MAVLSTTTKYLCPSGVPTFRFKDNCKWFPTVFGIASHSPCHPMGEITISSILSVKFVRTGFFCKKRFAFAFWTNIFFFMKLIASHFLTLHSIFGPIVSVFFFGYGPPGHYITLMKMPINMVTIRPVNARM